MKRTGEDRRLGRGLARAAGLALAALGVGVGCGRDPGPPRFVPGPGASDRPAPAADPDRARPEVRKIEMH